VSNIEYDSKIIPRRSSSLSFSAFVNCADCRMRSAVSFIVSEWFSHYVFTTQLATVHRIILLQILEINDFLTNLCHWLCDFCSKTFMFYTCPCSAHAWLLMNEFNRGLLSTEISNFPNFFKFPRNFLFSENFIWSYMVKKILYGLIW
jgi:hypothetical protein